MIEKNTVFILGAGASKPYGYPSGKELRRYLYSEYIDYLRSSKILDSEVDIKTVEKFASDFFDAGQDISIDRFLSMNKSNTAYGIIGRFGILKYITDCEVKSAKNNLFNENIEKPEYDWYSFLSLRLIEDFSEKDGYTKYSSNKVNFITFNYDRSFEYYMFNSFRKAYITHFRSDLKEVQKYFNLNIIHVYGVVAPLYGVNDAGSRYGIWDDDHVLSSIDNIKIIYDERSSENIIKAREIIQQADQIYILGFGYDKMNLEILGFPFTKTGKIVRIFGTAFELTEGERNRINGLLIKGMHVIHYKNYIHLYNNDSRYLLRECL